MLCQTLINYLLLMNQKRYIIISIIILFIMNGCSVTNRVLIPNEGVSWDVNDDYPSSNTELMYALTNISIKVSALYKCDDFNIGVGYIGLTKDPTRPMSPPGSLYTIITSSMPYKILKLKQPICPEVIIHNPAGLKATQKKIISGDAGQYACTYEIDNANMISDGLIISFNFINNNCITSKLNYKQENRWIHHPLF